MNITTDVYRDQEIKAQEFAHNRTLMNRDKKVRSVLIFFYMFPLAIYLPAAIFMGMLSYVVTAALDAVIIVPLTAYCAWLALYRYRDFMAVLVIVIMVANQLLLGFLSPYENVLFYHFNIFSKCSILHLVLLAFCVVSAVINLRLNVTYHKLEEADGFPQFNERFFEQEMDRKQFGIKNPYQQVIDERKKTASDTMQDVGFVQGDRGCIENGQGSGTMDSI